MNIPKQLQNPEFRFILVNTKTKIPIEEEWTTKNNYPYDNPKLIALSLDKFSYGVLGGPGNLVIIDSDSVDLASWIETNFPETLTIQSGSHEPGKYHYYFLTEKPYNKRVLSVITEDKTEKKFGELQGIGSMVIGPGCLHKSGKTYDVIRNIPIANISDDLLKKIIKEFSNVEEVTEKENSKFQERKFESDDIEQQLNITHIWSLAGLKKYKDEYYGSHPTHGSTTGMNFWINPGKNVWSCFRHKIGNKAAGGGVAMALAVQEGLIDCSQAHGKLDKEVYKRVLEIAENNYGYLPKGKGLIPAESQDELKNLEIEINETDSHKLRTNIDNYLTKINQVQNYIFQKYLISKIAYKIKVGKIELEKQLLKIKNQTEEKNPIAINELLKQESPNIEYNIMPIIPKGSCILIGGKPGAGKSLFALAIALSLKQKGKFLSQFDVLAANPKILYYDLENAQNVFRWRLDYLIKGLGVKSEDLKGFNLESCFNKANIEREIELSKGYDVIVLDSYRRFLEGTENDSDFTNKFFNEYLKPLLDLGKTLIILHHLKKAKLSELEDEDLMDIFRGSSDIPAQFDLIYGLVKGAEITLENDNIIFDISIIKVKNRLGLPIKDFTFRVSKNDSEKKTEFTFSYFGKSLKPKERIQDKILELLKIQGEVDRKTIHELIIAETGSNIQITTTRYLKEMVENGLIIQTGYGKYKLPGG